MGGCWLAGGADLGETGETISRHIENIAVAQPVDIAQINLTGFQRLLRADNDAARAGVEMDDIERLAGGDADAAALADRVVQNAIMAAEHAAVQMNDIARQRRVRLQLVDDIGIFALRHETDVLAVGLFGDDEAHVLGELPRFRLSEIAERKRR